MPPLCDTGPYLCGADDTELPGVHFFCDGIQPVDMELAAQLVNRADGPDARRILVDARSIGQAGFPFIPGACDELSQAVSHVNFPSDVSGVHAALPGNVRHRRDSGAMWCS